MRTVMVDDLTRHAWQRNLGLDVAAMVRAALVSGRLPWISYDADELGGRLVREYADGRRVFVSYVGEVAQLTPAPSRGR
jgi:hypothetical protein